LNQEKNVEDLYPLTPAQQGMLMYLVLAGSEPEVFCDRYVATLRGALDLEAWRAAWQRVVDRHPSLRTLFLWERRERPLQVVRRTVELPYVELDWRSLAAEEREERFAAFLLAERRRGFDLGTAPLLRIAMVRFTDDTCKFVWSFHHLVLDGWSLGRVFGEFLQLYLALRAGSDLELPPARPYRDFIAWLQRQDLESARVHWTAALADADVPAPLPLDGTGAALVGDESRVAERRLALDSASRGALDDFARRHGLTLNTLFQGAWALTLGLYAGRDDVVFGGVVAGRPYDLEGIETMVGMFVNVLPVRVRLPWQEPLLPWLAALQSGQVEQRDFEYCPLEQIQAWCGVPHTTPLFDSLLIVENYPIELPRDAGGLPFEVVDSHLAEASNYPLCLYVVPRAGGLDFRVNFHRDRFSPAAVERILAAFAATLRRMAAAPAAALADLVAVSEPERAEILAWGVGRPAAAARDERGETVVDLFLRRAALEPARPAIEDGERTLSYGELAVLSGALARQLRAQGAGAESVVGLCLERSAEMVVGMLGILRAGAAYLPLDPAYPRERLAFVVADSRASLVLCGAGAAPVLDTFGARARRIADLLAGEEEPGAAPAVPFASCHLDPRQPAYLIYTSGSTGRPKGVVVPHGALANYVRYAVAGYGIGSADRVLQFASMSFDTSAEEIYSCLAAGGTLVLRSAEMAASLSRFAAETAERRITVLDLPTAFWHELVAEMETSALALPETLRLVILGGEAAQAARLAAWRRRAGDGVRLLNTYGPTEATIVSTVRDVTAGIAAAEVPIGRPVDGARAFVLGRGLEPLPAGAVGELYLGGAGLARGYLGSPELTAQRFLPCPTELLAAGGSAGGGRGERIYRSGDRARFLPDGDLEFRGRADDQVKIRGFRIELGEIESVLRRTPGVREAVVVARQDGPGPRRLVAYVVPEARGELLPACSGEGLRAAVRAELPDYMVPAACVLLPALPLTPSGKVDRRALPAPELERAENPADAVPRGAVQEVLAGIWSDLLAVERIGIHDDFFQLGGHSLIVAKLASRIRQAFKVELPMVEVFKRPTLAELAAAIERAERSERADSEAALPELPPIARLPRDERGAPLGTVPLSFPQERVWFLNQIAPGGRLAYNFQVTIWLRGALQVPALDAALSEIVRRHESLRTTFPTRDGQPVQVVGGPWVARLPVCDLRALPAAARQEESERLVLLATQVPFDVTELPLIRWRLLRLEDDLWELIQVEHHFVHDGWSFSVLLKEIKALYAAFVAGEPSPLAALPVQYADYAAWQRGWMEGPALDGMLAYWRRKLAGSPTVLELPADRPRPARSSFTGDLDLTAMDPELYQELRAFGRKNGFTLFMTTLAGFFALLRGYSGADDVLLGTSNANRRVRELEGLIGMIVNSLVLRGDMRGDPKVAELLARVRETSLESSAYQDMPLERLVAELQPERELGRNPLFQIMFGFHDAAIPDLEFGGLKGSFRVRGNRSAKMDLNVIIVPRAEQRVGLAASAADRHAWLHWEYSTELFDLPTMQRMKAHYQNLLGAMIAHPELPLSRLSMLSAGERRQLTHDWNDTAADYAGAPTLPELLAAQVDRTPDAPALRCAGQELSYAELDARANGLARALQAQGAGPDVLVGVAMERSLEMVVALLAVLKAGGAYVPLDPGYPAERLAFMVEDSDVRVLLTQERLAAALPATRAAVLAVDRPGAFQPARRRPEAAASTTADNLAYMIYTSGSTGQPKGAMNSHRGIRNRLLWMQAEYGLAADDRVLQKTPFSFDVSVWEFFWPLITGATLVIAKPGGHQDPSYLVRTIAEERITTLHFVPSMLAAFLEERDLARCAPLWRLRRVLCSGEALPPELVARFCERMPAGIELHNLYGPTEAAVDVSYWACGTVGTTRMGSASMGAASIGDLSAGPSAAGSASRGSIPASMGSIPIGRPVANTRLHVVDRDGQPAPPGVHGELLIGGVQLGRGYHRRPELTAERFVPDPFAGELGVPGARLYRTGDLARLRPDGAIDFLGRIDHQVKVRGFRIELGEIEAALGALPAVRDCAVAVCQDEAFGAQLVAYVVPAAGTLGEPEIDALREALAARLPEHMVPSLFVGLAALPLSPNGKLDRKALPRPAAGLPDAGELDDLAAPRGAVEAELARIWCGILGLERVGVRKSFFHLGGHSLSATRMLARVRDAFGVELPLPVVFERRTIEGLARAIAERREAAERDEPAAAIGPLAAGSAALLAQAAALSDSDLDALLGELLPAGGRP
jgi:amino acid adenylation domain-containing protein